MTGVVAWVPTLITAGEFASGFMVQAPFPNVFVIEDVMRRKTGCQVF